GGVGGGLVVHAGGQTGEDSSRLAHQDEPLQGGEGGAPAELCSVEGYGGACGPHVTGARGRRTASATQVWARRPAASVAAIRSMREFLHSDRIGLPSHWCPSSNSSSGRA